MQGKQAYSKFKVPIETGPQTICSAILKCGSGSRLLHTFCHSKSLHLYALIAYGMGYYMECKHFKGSIGG